MLNFYYHGCKSSGRSGHVDSRLSPISTRLLSPVLLSEILKNSPFPPSPFFFSFTFQPDEIYFIFDRSRSAAPKPSGRRSRKPGIDRKPRQAYSAKQLERLEAEFKVSLLYMLGNTFRFILFLVIDVPAVLR